MSIEKEIKKLLESSRKTEVQEEVVETVEELQDEELSDDQIIEDILALDELSKKTLGNYIKKAASDTKEMGKIAAAFSNRPDNKKAPLYKDAANKTINKRINGIIRATDRLTKEQKETIETVLEELETEGSLEEGLHKAPESISKSKIMKKINDGHWEAVNDVVVGKHIQIRDNKTKQNRTIHVKEDVSVEVDVSEDVDALLNGEDLTEEFKTKAATIFEAAVVTRVKQEVAKLEEDYETRLDEQVESIKEELAEKVDGYLNYIVEKWMEDNEIALTNGIKLEVMEKFVSGIKNVFEENYIEVPEEKFDVLASMEEKLKELETKLDESLEKNVELNTTINSFNRKGIVAEACDGLTDTQVEKFKTLAEELSYEDEESFKGKLKTIRENYFSNKKSLTETKVSFITDDPIVEEVEATKLSPLMNAYVSALTKK